MEEEDDDDLEDVDDNVGGVDVDDAATAAA